MKHPSIAKRLATFEKHKPKLIETLNSCRRADVRHSTFDKKAAWDELIRTAEYLFWHQVMREDGSNNLRLKNLASLSRHLSNALMLLNRGDVQTDLMRALFEVRYDNNLQKANSAAGILLQELKDAATRCRTLEEAARKASVSVRRRSGRPNDSSAISSDYIIGLAKLYRNVSGKKPGTGLGPFASLVGSFLEAVGQNIASDSVPRLLKLARHDSLTKQRNNSPFRTLGR